MAIRSLQTPETLKQLDYDFWRAVRALAKSRTRYFRNANTEKVKPQEEVLNLFHHLEGLMKQMTVKIINHSRTVATAISNEALTNPKKRKENMSGLLRLGQIFENLQVDAGTVKQMSNGVGNLASGVRKQINGIINNTQTQLAQIAKREQQVQKARVQHSRQSKGRLIPRFGFGGA